MVPSGMEQLFFAFAEFFFFFFAFVLALLGLQDETNFVTCGVD
jgi:hypothetical protein